MLNFYHKISICPGYQILSEENESFLLERSNTFYSTAIKIYNTDKIDESLFEDNENNMSALVILSACKILNEEHLYKIGKSTLERIFYKKIYFYQKEKG